MSKSSQLQIVLFILVIVIFLSPLKGAGLLVGNDWTFPFSQVQLKNFYDDGFTIWNRIGTPLGTQIPHKNLYILQLLSYPFVLLGGSGVFFQKFLICAIFLLMAFIIFRFLEKIFHNPLASFIGSLIYVFSPIVFNYFNMGWIYVLLYMAFQPLVAYQTHEFVTKGGWFRALLIAIVTSICFFQAQSMVWIPIIITSVTIGSLRKKTFRGSVVRFFILIFVTIMISFLVHMPWVIPSFVHQESYISAPTSANDIRRFSEIANLTNQLRGWGSLFNEQFEISFGKSPFLYPFSFVAAFLSLLSLIKSEKNKSDWLKIGSLLLLVSPFLYVSRDLIGSLPFSNIVRDVSRFIVIGNLGASILVGSFVTSIKTTKAKLLIALSILISIYPFLTGRLYVPQRILYGVSETGKDQRVRFLVLPEKENEEVLKYYQSQSNLFFPTGGFVYTNSDKRFQGAFAEIGDVDSQFSPYGFGIYISDKSNQSYLNFSREYLSSSVESEESFMRLSRIFGISNIFIRNGLVSNFNKNINSGVKYSSCIDTGLKTSDWSVRYICQVQDPFPLMFIDNSPKQQGNESFDKYLKSGYFDNGFKAVFRCENSVSCGQNFDSKQSVKTPDKIDFKSIGRQKYLVNIEPNSGYSLLVLNQTYHPGWIVVDPRTKKHLKLPHVVANNVVNGWELPPSSKNSSYLIEFYPQVIYEKLYPVSVLFFVLLIFGTVYLYIKVQKND